MVQFLKLEMDFRKFARRIKWTMDRFQSRYAFFIGAGCSVPSGVPDAGDLALEWLKELRMLEGEDPGSPREQELARLGENPSRHYREVLEQLFIFEAERKMAILKLTGGIKPSEGYHTLAGLMSSANYGRYCNIAISTNFDNLLAEAFHGKDHLVVCEEESKDFIRINCSKPVIIKLSGDARHFSGDGAGQSDEAVVRMLQGLLTGLGLIFIGYGGNDKKIVKALGQLPGEALSRGVYWVNSRPPGEELSRWLDQNSAVWVRHSHFEELLSCFGREFGLTGQDPGYLESERSILKNGFRMVGNPGQIRLESLFNRYIFTTDEGEREKVMNEIGGLVGAGVTVNSPCLQSNVEMAVSNGHPRSGQLKKLYEVVSGQHRKEEITQNGYWDSLTADKTG